MGSPPPKSNNPKPNKHEPPNQRVYNCNHSKPTGEFVNRRVVATDGAPTAIGPYSQAVWAGDCLFCAGQIPLDPATGNLVTGGITEQTARVLENIRAILRSQGLDFTNVVKSTVFLSDMNNFAAMNDVYANYFPKDPPARSTVQVSRLPKDALIEIEVIASR